MKHLVEQFDIIAKEYLDMIQHSSNSPEIESWFEIHGWNNSDAEPNLFVARQSILNAVIRQIFSNLTFKKTPFDFVKVPQSLIDRIQEMNKSSLSFNFWGDINNILIPQSQRRLIGQFWTDELIADWMVSWLLSFQPNLLVDAGCGSGNFLIKAGQHLRDNNLSTQLYGFDISPLMLNITQANFSDHDLITPNVLDYISQGETENYHFRSLVQTRKKWYFMEQREIPAIFFTILTRGNPRFILNKADVRPLNMFLLIYPNTAIIQADCIEILWVLLNCTFSISRLHSVSRTYGGNTLKVEPRELDNLPVINPLSLPKEYRQKIKSIIDKFYYHRKANILIEEASKLVDSFLDSKIVTEHSFRTPVQLQLLDTQIKYD